MYNGDDVDTLRTELTNTTPSLAPEWIDLLAVVAYVRHHVATLEYLVATYTAPEIPSFDSFASFRSPLKSPLEFTNGNTRLTLIRMWAAILRSNTNGWAHLHRPTPGSADAAADPDRYWDLRLAVIRLLEDWTPHDEALRSSTTVADLLTALSDMDIALKARTIAQLLTTIDGAQYGFETYRAIPCSLATAEMIIKTCFPPSGFKDRNATSILMPLAMVEASTPGYADRVKVMRLVLDHGCYVNSRAWMSQWGERTPYSRYQDGTVLWIAAERGDMEMVELLLEFGAQGTMHGHGGKLPSQIAREYGHVAVAERIEGEMGRLSRRG